jgi:hypothetical protein
MPREPSGAATRAERLWLCYVMPLAFVSGIKEAEPHLVKQLLYSGIVKDLASGLPEGCLPLASTTQRRCRRDGVRSWSHAAGVHTNDVP